MSTQGTPRPSIDEKGRQKAPPPDFFDGNRNKIDHWLMQMDLYFRFNGSDVSPKDRASVAAMYLRGKAQDWIKPYLSDYLSGGKNHQFMDEWAKMRIAMKQIYGISNDQAVAIRRVQNLRQVRSASEYASEFQEASPKTGWDNEALKEMFKKGLKLDVRKELMRYGGDTDTLMQLIHAAIECDDQLYEFYADTRQKNQAGRRATHGGRGFRRDPDAMELDALLGKSKGKVHNKKVRGKAGVTCYACGKSGHIARNCRSKEKMPRPQLNVLRGKEKESAGTANSDLDLFAQVWDDEEDADIRSWERVVYTPEGSSDDGVASLPNDDEELETEFEGLHKEPGYAVDPRHPWHDQMPWTFCSTESCAKHERPKEENPEQVLERWCQKRWNECRTDECPEHLIDKRMRGCFPGHDAAWNNELRQHRWESGPCTYDNWVNCLKKACERHQKEKRCWGFAPALEDPEGRDPEPGTIHLHDKRLQLGSELRYVYSIDPRNRKHALEHFSSCYSPSCKKHTTAKKEHGWVIRPGVGNICTWRNWSYCRRYDCALHLEDKRQAASFPGRSRAQDAQMLDQAIDSKAWCSEDTWQTCLRYQCSRHYWLHERHGCTTFGSSGKARVPPHEV
jgi:Retrotransposon gag protein/Zinc knuckle